MELTRGQKALVLIGLAAILLALVILSLAHSHRSRVESTVGYVTPPPAALPTQVAVHVVGAVNRPGVYWLTQGTRVSEAIEQAGGLRPDADPSSINLAAVLQDGEQVRVEVLAGTSEPPAPPAATRAPAPPVTPSPSATSTPAPAAPASPRPGPTLDLAQARPVSLTLATEAELQDLPKVGPQLAANIVHYRTQHGPFRTVDDLAHVPGFGDGRLEAVRPYVRP